MLFVGSIPVDDAAACAGFMAAAIAVCGFLLQAPAALRHKADAEVRASMVAGGLFGFLIALAVVILGEW